MVDVMEGPRPGLAEGEDFKESLLPTSPSLRSPRPQRSCR